MELSSFGQITTHTGSDGSNPFSSQNGFLERIPSADKSESKSIFLTDN
jgi:hypothetical protein